MSTAITELMQAYLRARQAAAEFRSENKAVVEKYLERQATEAEARLALEAAIKATPDMGVISIGIGETDDGFTQFRVTRRETCPRRVDARRLLELVPRAQEWPDLLSVTVRELDRAVASGLITREQAESSTYFGKPSVTAVIEFVGDPHDEDG